jgi:hypothetical protein
MKMAKSFSFHKWQENSWLAEQLLASQKVLWVSLLKVPNSVEILSVLSEIKHTHRQKDRGPIL